MHRFLARGQRVAAIAVTSALLLGASVAAHAQKVKLATSAGDIVIELDKAKAPKTVDNFVAYVKDGHYNGTVFHRVIPNFMIQGGGMVSTFAGLKEKPTHKPIVNESHNGLSNTTGTIAMARTGDPNSATAQFFINVKDNPFLDQGDGYAVFGHVVSGMDVVEKIKTVETTTKGPFENVPVNPVIIKKATLEK